MNPMDSSPTNTGADAIGLSNSRTSTHRSPQSDTVVFQAAKIPPSSALLTVESKGSPSSSLVSIESMPHHEQQLRPSDQENHLHAYMMHTTSLKDAAHPSHTPAPAETNNIHSPSQGSSSSSPSTITVRLTVRFMKQGDTLGFGIRNNPNHPCTVSTLPAQTNASSLLIGDAIIRVNGTDLSNMNFIQVVQFLKATKPGELVFEIDRHVPKTQAPVHGEGHGSVKQPHVAVVSSSSSSDRTRTTPPVVSEPSNIPRKRARPAAGSTSTRQWESELHRMEKQHRIVVSSLSMELKKETTKKLAAMERNASLRKRLQQMLIDCDDVRVQAKQSVASIQDQAQKERQELERALQAATAQLRLQDRAPDVGRTDSIVQELQTTRMQLERMKKMEMTRTNRLAARFAVEIRLAERQVVRVKERLIELVRGELRVLARRRYGIVGNTSEGSSQLEERVQLRYEGLGRLAFRKLFGLECTFEWYNSEAFYTATVVEHRMEQMKELVDVLGTTLCHEERTGVFLVAVSPMEVVYDPEQEQLTISCPCTEQNQIRELARSVRF